MFKRLSNIIRGFFSLFVGGVEKQNPEALLELEKENLRKQIANYNQGLASHAGLCERLISQVKRLEIEDRDLRAKTTALLRLFQDLAFSTKKIGKTKSSYAPPKNAKSLRLCHAS